MGVGPVAGRVAGASASAGAGAGPGRRAGAGRRLPALPGGDAAAGRRARHRCGQLRAPDRRPAAGPQRAAPAQRPARVHHPDLGLPGRAGRPAARGRWPRDAGSAPRTADAHRTRVRRGCRNRGRGVGRGKRLRPDYRQAPAAGVAGHPGLRRPAPGVLPRRTPGPVVVAGLRRPGRPGPHRFLGRRLRPDPVHAQHLCAHRGGWRWRRSP